MSKKAIEGRTQIGNLFSGDVTQKDGTANIVQIRPERKDPGIPGQERPFIKDGELTGEAVESAVMVNAHCKSRGERAFKQIGLFDQPCGCPCRKNRQVRPQDDLFPVRCLRLGPDDRPIFFDETGYLCPLKHVCAGLNSLFKE